MRRILLNILNFAALFIILVGGPAVSGVSIGGLVLSSSRTWQTLVLAGLLIAVAANLVVAFWLGKRRDIRNTALGWMCVYSGFFVLESLFFAGVLDFQPLKKFLIKITELT
ncbi:MAG: hypothetical protein K9N48_03685 [Verrucomicrobia bacterium]|nr:hypothetical protein [Verrucomicrobiota bacterium]MCF7708683.1 hypothetical protein [Verrucomicrobiota bacterium]